MKITLIKELGNKGVITEYKKIIGDRLDFEIGEDGVLVIGQACYRTQEGKASIPEYHLVQGNNRLTFTSQDGTNYQCGAIARSGRFMGVINNIEEITVGLALAYLALKDKNHELEKRLKDIEDNHGIKII